MIYYKYYKLTLHYPIIPYKHLVFSFPSDLMKTTAVVESLSYYKTNVLFQRIPAYFKIYSTV